MSKKLKFNQTNKKLSSLVLKTKKELFSKEVNSILPVTFRTFNTQNSVSKQKFAFDSLFKRIGVDKEMEKNKRRVLVVAYLLKSNKRLSLSQELKDYLQESYSFSFILDEKALYS